MIGFKRRGVGQRPASYRAQEAKFLTSSLDSAQHCAIARTYLVSIELQPVESRPHNILAIDGHSLLYRAYFALPDTIRDPSGRPVNAIYGFVSMFSRLLKEHRPDGVVVAFDSPWPTLRHSIFPAYKQNRAALPEALLAQVPLLQTLLRRTGIRGIAVPGYEGDDILASLAEHCSTRQVTALLVTGDRDLFQLVRDPWIRVLYTKRGVSSTQVLDENAVERLVGVPPSRYADLAALRGDPADNIPGVAGIGEKGALALIGCAPSFEELYIHPESLPGELAKKILAGRETLLSNRELMRPLTTIPLNWETEPIRFAIDVIGATEAFAELGLAKACDALLSVWSQLHPTASCATVSPKVSDLFRRRKRVCLVSCSADKAESEANAEDLYISALFKKSRAWAELTGAHWYILSAKYGMVSPDTSLHPYDMCLKNASPQERELWGSQVISELGEVASPPDIVFLLAGSTYSAAILRRLVDTGYRVVQPLEGMSIGRRLHWLNAAVEAGRGSADLEEFYEILTTLASDTGGLQSLATADQRAWPERGVYFFFEPGENRLCSTRPRVVRVGTHAVSANSKATLWNRLRTHRGVAEGGGNHRSSIFRSHVGAAIIRRDSRIDEFPDWGDQSAGTSDNKGLESELENLVSATLSRMQVLCIQVPDSPGSRSDRAYIERNAIALLSKVASRVDAPSDTWLGRSSAHPSIRKSGLWNVNYVDEPGWDPQFLEVFDYYARATVHKVPFVAGSVAPFGWWDRVRSPNQMSLSWSEEDDDAGRD
jgi:5'-3' exonuclease